jgi:r-opsin
MTCSYDYLTEDWNHKSYILYAFINNYALPMIIVIFFYSQITKAVVSHEAALRAQAKKMNVESLRTNTVSFIFLNTTKGLQLCWF